MPKLRNFLGLLKESVGGNEAVRPGNLDRHDSFQFRIECLPDLPEAACADQFIQTVSAKGVRKLLPGPLAWLFSPSPPEESRSSKPVHRLEGVYPAFQVGKQLWMLFT